MEHAQFDIISPTALLVAYARQFSNIPYTKELLNLLGTNTVVAQFEATSQVTINLLALLLEARYKAVERMLNQQGHTQVLELASGLLPRGIVWSQHPAITFVESDLSSIIQLKQQLVKQLIGERANLQFETINVADRSNPLLSATKHFRHQQPITVICEGLLQYLTLPEKVQVFANVRDLLQRYGGQWITPDLATKVAQQQIEQYSTASENLNQQILNLTGRSLVENSFDTMQHIQQFVTKQGFSIEMHRLLDIVDDLRCLESLDIFIYDIQPLLAERFVSILEVKA